MPITLHSIVDFERSDVVYFDDVREPDYARHVVRWVVDDSKIPDVDVFADEFALGVVSDTLRNDMLTLKPTGIMFIALAELYEPLIGT